MNLLTKIKLNQRQKALGIILIIPWYLYFAPIIFKFLITIYSRFNSQAIDGSINVYYNLLITLTTAFILVVMYRDFIIENWKIFKQNLLENIIWTLTIGLVAVYFFSFIGEMFVNLFLPFDARQASNQELVVTLVSYNAGIMVFNAVILAPIVEELIFRGLIFNSLRQKSKLWAHLISAFLFGFLHVYSYILSGDMSEWIKLIPYMMAGLAFSFAYERRQNIGVPILLHSIKNLIAMILIYIML